MRELVAAAAESYEETGELKLTAEELGVSALKIRKLLITAGVYSNCGMSGVGFTIDKSY